VHRYKAGEPWWLETPALEALATAEQAARFVVDVWEETVREGLGDATDVAMEDVLRVLGFKKGQWTQAHMNRASGVLTHLGFRRVRARNARKSGGREWRYRRDPKNVAS
jgi:predicted P-loop ATPase